MRNLPFRSLSVVVLALLTAPLGGCLSGGLNLRNNVERASFDHASYDQIFEMARQTLDELGTVDRASREQGIIMGQIPPYKVKAVLDRPNPQIQLVGLDHDRSCWARDSVNRIWIHDCDGRAFSRKGADSAEGAVAAWSEALRRQVK